MAVTADEIHLGSEVHWRRGDQCRRCAVLSVDGSAVKLKTLGRAGGEIFDGYLHELTPVYKTAELRQSAQTEAQQRSVASQSHFARAAEIARAGREGWKKAAR